MTNPGVESYLGGFERVVMKPVPLRIVYFDLGDTLMRKVASTPGGIQFDWVDGAKDVLARLRAAGMELGLISNTGTLTRIQLASLLPSDFNFGLFDADLVLLSSEVGMKKPDPRIFRLAISRAQDLSDPGFHLEIDPAECLFVGESLEEVLCAQNVGMIGARVQMSPPDIGSLDTVLIDRGFLA